jgi:hypothetical protein
MFDNDRHAGTRDQAGLRAAVIASFAALSVAAFAITVVTAWQAGITWDDGIELLALHDELALLQHGAPDYAAASSGIKYLNAWYGIVPAGIAHLIAWSLKLEQAWDVDFTASAYAVRHFVALGFGVLCVAVLTVTAWRLTRQVVVAASLPALLFALPTFGGHAAINIKDTPVACGLTMLACGLALALRSLQVRGGRAGALVLIGCGTCVAVGTRGGSVALVAALVGTTGIAALVLYGRSALRTLLWSAAAVLVGVAGVVVSNPVATYAPLRWLIDCVRIASLYTSTP